MVRWFMLRLDVQLHDRGYQQYSQRCQHSREQTSGDQKEPGEHEQEDG